MLVDIDLVSLLKLANWVSRGGLCSEVRLWTEDGMLQVQRKAYGIGFDKWAVRMSAAKQAGAEGWIEVKSVPVYEGGGRQGVMLPSLVGDSRHTV